MSKTDVRWYILRRNRARRAAQNPQPGAQPLKVLFIGSSTPEKYFTEYGTTTSPEVTKTTNGTTFTPVGSTGLGAGIFGNVLNTALSRPIQLFSFGVGGSTVKEWDDNASGKTYRTAAVNAAKAAGGVDYVICSVGRNDAQYGVATSMADHLARLRSLFSKLRTELGQPNIKIILGMSQNSYASGSSTYDALYDNVHEAENQVLADSNIFFGGHAWDLSQESDGIHLSQTAYPYHATRLADNLLRIHGGMAPSQGPRITAVTGITYTTTEVTLTHSLGTDFTPTSGATGFTATANGAALTITGIDRTAANKLLITHANNNGNPVTIYFQKGASGVKTAPLRDNDLHKGLPGNVTTIGLPLNHLPFGIAAASAGTPVAVTSKSAKVNFTRTADQYAPATPTGWNAWMLANTTGTWTNGTVITKALNTPDGTATGWSIANTTDLGGVTIQGDAGGTNSVFPAAVRTTYTYRAYPDPAGFKITGLDPASTYDIVAFGSRTGTVGDTRTTNYVATGANTVSGSIANTINNQSVNATLTGCAPNASGEIVLTTTAANSASQFGYIGGITITEIAPPANAMSMNGTNAGNMSMSNSSSDTLVME